MDSDYFDFLKSQPSETPQTPVNEDNRDMVNLTVRVDVECQLICDGNFLFIIPANQIVKEKVPFGQHILNFTSIDFPNATVEQIVDFPIVGNNYLVVVNNLAEKVEIEKSKLKDENTIKQTQQSEVLLQEEIKKGFFLFENKQYEEAIPILVKAAQTCNNVQAQYSLGNYYRDNKDYIEAVRWYRMAADQGDAKALNCLAMRYQTGQGVTKDEKKAFELIKRSADQGFNKAQNNLGDCYRFGEGVEVDFQEAIKMYILAAQQKNIGAHISLGDMYKDGIGVTQDYSEAIRWYTFPAEQGNVNAQNKLAHCYCDVEAVRDYGKAFHWYQKSAEQGHANSQCNLGWCYHFGHGVECDYEKAIEWYEKAGDDWSKNKIKQICATLGHDFRDQGNHEEAEKWYKKGISLGAWNLIDCLGNEDDKKKWYIKGAENNDYLSQWMLSFDPDYYSQSVHWLEKMLDDETNARNILGNSKFDRVPSLLAERYLWGDGVKQDFRKAYDLLQKAPMQNRLLYSLFLFDGDEDYCEKNVSKAIEIFDSWCREGGLGKPFGSEEFWYSEMTERDWCLFESVVCAICKYYYDKKEPQYQKAYDCLKRIWQDTFNYNWDSYAHNGETFFYRGEFSYWGHLNQPNYEEAFKFYTQSAELGFHRAELMIGVCYLRGQGVSQDVAKGFDFIKKSADGGQQNAAMLLGDYYFRSSMSDLHLGIMVTRTADGPSISLQREKNNNPDYDSAYKYYLIASGKCDTSSLSADKSSIQYKIGSRLDGPTKSIKVLGTCFSEGYGVEKSNQNAIELYKVAVENGDVDSLYYLSNLYYKEKSYTLAFECANKAIKNGVKDAYLIVADCYYNANGVPRDLKKAFELYEESAKYGEGEAKRKIIHMYIWGEYVKKDIAEAIKIYDKYDPKPCIYPSDAEIIADYFYDKKSFKEAAEWYGMTFDTLFRRLLSYDKYARVCFKEAYSNYKSGNYERAFKLFNEAIELKSSPEEAMRMIGICYEEGHGVSRDLEKSEMWFKRAADAGDNIAMVILGNNYWSKSNDSMAITYYTKAAKRGYLHAKWRLGAALFTTKQYTESYHWLSECSPLWDPEARSLEGFCHFFGLGTIQSNDSAATCFESAVRDNIINYGDFRLKLPTIENTPTKKMFNMLEMIVFKKLINGNSLGSFDTVCDLLDQNQTSGKDLVSLMDKLFPKDKPVSDAEIKIIHKIKAVKYGSFLCRTRKK